MAIMHKKMTIFLIVLGVISSLQAENGKKVFETYCWGCHHQTAVAFGPPFSEIASKRTAEEIQAMITDPFGVSKLFGYKRNAMPSFELKKAELDAITAYILSYKPHAPVKEKP
jgi:mono/diheme cytochrome c family protein